MEIKEKTKITVEASINAPVEKVWSLWNDPKHIIRWNSASPDWHTTYAENNLHEGEKFLSRMEAKDQSSGFDFEGEYTKVERHKLIEYVMPDGREVSVSFIPNNNTTTVREVFDPETENSLELQKQGWQAILNNFKKYVEATDESKIIHFDVKINAPAEKVYKTMLNDTTFRDWTSVFNPTSHYKGSWKKGAKILFIGEDKDGNKGGMVSRIRENIPDKFVSIEHVGILQGDKEVTSGKEVEGWAGALENYTFKRDDDETIVLVDMDSNDEFISYFQETWPRALEKLKKICEL